MNYKPTIIIGAGLSGLTIASQLDEHDFFILEARDRIGGRVHTVSLGEKTIDMGAAWIHGSVNNPLNPFLKYDEMIPVSDKNPWMHPETSQIQNMCLTEDTWRQIANEIANMKDKTVGEACAEIAGKYNTEMSCFQYMLEVWYGCSISSMPSSFLQNIEYNDSLFGDYAGSHYLFKKGTGSLITSIVEGAKQDLKDKIIFEQVVTYILYDRPGKPIEIRTRDNNVYYCDKLCITVPPGPLKDIKFCPPLSASRKCALSKIKMGSYKKIQLTFDSVFWNNDAAMILTQSSSFTPYILWNNYGRTKGLAMLEAICPANVGWQLSGKSDEIIADAVLEHMHNYYPQMPDPVA